MFKEHSFFKKTVIIIRFTTTMFGLFLANIQ